MNTVKLQSNSVSLQAALFRRHMHACLTVSQRQYFFNVYSVENFL